jgi:hypothetical protein
MVKMKARPFINIKEIPRQDLGETLSDFYDKTNMSTLRRQVLDDIRLGRIPFYNLDTDHDRE